MNATKRIAGLVIGLGLSMSTANAFAHHYPMDRGLPIPGMLDYDYDGDRLVNRDEFEQRELYACHEQFVRSDPNQDRVITSQERANSAPTYCDAWYTTHGSDYVVRSSHRFGRSPVRVIRHRDEGLTWNELRDGSVIESRRRFAAGDLDRNGVLNMRELNLYVTNQKERAAAQIAAANQPAPRHIQRAVAGAPEWTVNLASVSPHAEGRIWAQAGTHDHHASCNGND